MKNRAEPLAIAVRTASAGWRAPVFADARQAVRRAVQAGFFAAEMTARGEVSICLSDDAHMRQLNKVWRGKNAATNVLAFPPPPDVRLNIGLWGDIILAEETLLREAKAARLPPTHHLAQLVIHGTLHLLGYDHDTASAARAMKRLERKAWRQWQPPAVGRALSGVRLVPRAPRWGVA